MNDFFRRLPLMVKLLAIAIVPLIFIGYLTIELYGEKSDNVTLVRNYLATIDQSMKLTGLASELQKERRYSFVYALNNSGHKEMLAQRPYTDNILNELHLEHDESLKDFTSYTYLGQLDSVRRLIDSGKYSKDRIMHFYSSTIFRLNTLNSVPSPISKALKQTNDEVVMQRLLGQLITYQSIVDANVFNVLFTRQYMVETLMGTYPTWDVYKTYQKEFKAKATTGGLKTFESFQANGALGVVDTYLDKLFSTFKFDSTFSYKSWAAAADSSLNELRAYQGELIKKVQTDVNSYYKKELSIRNQAVIFMVGIAALLMMLLAYILYIINDTLMALKRAAVQLSQGETDIRLQPQSKDAIGSLAASIRKIDEKNKELALAAQHIGSGNFNAIVAPRSERDLLGNAVVKMQEKLLDYTTELINAKAEFEKLADFMPQIVWTADRQGRINYYNKKWYQVTGAKNTFSDQVWIQVIHPDDAGHTLSAWYKSIESGQPFQMEYRIKDFINDTYRWFLGRAVPVVNTDNEIIKWFGTATDIQDQKMHEVRLEELVKQRTIELKRSNEDLQQFAHVASHDLKEPLRKISTFSQRLGLEFSDALPERGKVYLQKLQASSKRMTDMINSILNYSVINATEQTNDAVDLNFVLDGITNDLELVIMQKEAKINYQSLPRVKGASTLIYQLFYNLVNNALKFSKIDIPPTITISARKLPASELSGLADITNAGSYHYIRVEDNGIGFSQEHADQIFHIFSRLNVQDKYEGTGLGLALCRKIVHRHQGVIYATGEEGVGSCFHILLPINDESEKR